MSTDEPKFQFPDFLAEDYQRVLLALAVHDPDFYARARPILKPEYFRSSAFRAACIGLHEFWADRQALPQELDLRNRVKTQSADTPTQEAWEDVVRDIYNNDEYELNRPEIEKHLCDFAVRCESATVVGKAAMDIKQFDLSRLRIQLDEISRIPNLFGRLGADVQKEWVHATEHDPRTVFRTGFADFDESMRGGMREGDLVFFLGPQKRGKSQVLINMGAGLMKMGHNVVHYSMEMYELDVLRRYVACFSGIPTNELQDSRHFRSIEACMDALQKYTKARIILREWPGHRMTEVDLDAHLCMVEAQYSEKFVPVCDYMALMRAVHPTGDSWVDLPAMGVGCRNIARAHGVPFVSAHQTTTEGLYAKEIDERHMAGARALGTVVEYMWSINQSKDDYKVDRFSMAPFLSRHDRKDKVTYWLAQWDRARMKSISEDEYTSLRPTMPGSVDEDEAGLPPVRKRGGYA